MSTDLKVLFLLNEGFDTPGPSNHLMQTLVQDVLESGISVHMIESRRKRIYNDIPENLINLNNFTYNVVDRPNIEKKAFAKRYFEEILYSLRCIRYWKNKNDVDIVFIQSCPTALFPILLVKLFLRKPVVYSIQDMFPGSAVNSGVINIRLVADIFYKLQKIAYKYSDIITVISEDMKVKLMEHGVAQDKIHIIVNWYDDQSVHEVKWDENRFVKKYQLSKDKFYIQYAGTMGYVFDYKMVLDVAEHLKPYSDIEFHMIGQGSQKEAFVKEKEARELDNISFFPLEPQDMVSDVYSACSVCLIPLKRGIIGNSVPSKAGFLMACKRTIVNSVDEDSDYYKMFNSNDIGISITNQNPKDVGNAILLLYRNKDLRDYYANNGFQFGKKYYARSKNTKLYISIFERYCKE